MPRFAIIDNYSGFVWGVLDAPHEAAACAALDFELGAVARDYGPGFSGDTGYLVYEVPDGFDVDDGQDDEEIARVTAHGSPVRIGWHESPD